MSSINPIKNINVSELKDLLEAGEVNLIDVRETHEFANGAIEGAVNNPLSVFDTSKLDTEKLNVLQCQGGVRSMQAAQKSRAAGLENIANLEGGIMAWINSGFKTIKP